MAQTDFSPVAGDAFPIDGRVARETARDEAFSTIRTSAGDAVATGSIAQVAIITCSTTTNQFSAIERGIFCFDTSLIGSGNAVSSALLRLYCTAVDNTLGGSISIVKPAPASTSALAASDYNIAGWTMTKQATDIAISAITTGAYNEWTLNAAGIATINKTGTTVFGVVTSFDADNSAPTWSSGASSRLDIQYADGANAPILRVTYAPSASDDLSGYGDY